MATEKYLSQLDTLDGNATARVQVLDAISAARSMSEQGHSVFSALHQAEFFALIDRILEPEPVVEPEPEPEPVSKAKPSVTHRK